MALLVFKTSVGFERALGGFDSHSPPPIIPAGANERLRDEAERRMARRPRATGRRQFRGGARRLALAAILVAAGAALLLYGVAVHSRTVLLKQAEPPAAEAEKTIQESEPDLIREVSVGGVLRNPSGKIERTYGEGETPSLCPT